MHTHSYYGWVLKLLTDAAFMAKFHAIAAVVWLLIGVGGVAQYGVYLSSHPGELEKTLSTPLAASIPVLFFISVYANVVGHWSSFQASQVEKQQSQQLEEVTDDKH